MTPELAEVILQQPVNQDLLAIMDQVYLNYTNEELAAVIAHIRARITRENQARELDDAIALLVAEKAALKEAK